jgi:hypothetical protein
MQSNNQAVLVTVVGRNTNQHKLRPPDAPAAAPAANTQNSAVLNRLNVLQSVAEFWE